MTRTYRGFARAAEENGLSRIYAGIHFQHAVRDGRRQGRSIGQAVAEALAPRALEWRKEEIRHHGHPLDRSSQLGAFVMRAVGD